MKSLARRLTANFWFIPGMIVLVALAASAAIVWARTNQLPGSVSHNQHFTYECEKSQPTSMACEQQYYAEIVKTKNVAAAFTDLKKAYVTEPTVKANCHQLTHAIGRSAGEKTKGVEEAFAEGDNFCWSGYYHGVMELMAKKVGTKNIEEKITTICAKIAEKQKYSFSHYNCVHGLGHGVMAINSNELYDALEKCDEFTDSWEASSCHGGAFMENIMASLNVGNSSKYLKNDQPLYPCTAVDERYKQSCYMMQTSQALKVLNYDYAKVFELCSTIGSYAPTCFQSLGRDASGNSISDLRQTHDTCLIGKTEEGRANCITGAVKDFISYYNDNVKATQLCESFEPKLRDHCNDTRAAFNKTQ